MLNTLIEFQVTMKVTLNDELKPVAIEAVLPDGRSIRQDLIYDHKLNLDEEMGFIKILKTL